MKAIMSNLLDACKDGAQRTPLHHACINGHMELAMALVDSGADIHAEDDNQRTPLVFACVYGRNEVALALISRGANVHATEGAVDEDEWDGDEDEDTRPRQGTPAHYASVWGLLEVVMSLMDHGDNIHAEDELQMAPLHLSLIHI